MPFFHAIPEELIHHILVISGPKSVRSCSQVCHRLRDLICRSGYLQYLLELDYCGYDEPRHARSDLTYAQKLHLLRDHRGRWANLWNVQPTEYEVTSNEHGATYEFTGGIYVRGVSNGDLSSTRRLYFYQLPSRNRGIDYKHWCISDLGVDTRDFGLCPEQDLLVLLEIGTLPQEFPLTTNARVHLRSMTTNEPHPRTKSGQAVLTWCPVATDRFPDCSFYFEVSGDLLAVLFRSRTKSAASYVVIWDWTTGIMLSHTPTVGGWNASFTLLSENSFVVPGLSRAPQSSVHVSEDAFGSLDLYQFNPHSREPTKSRLVASFALPSLGHKQSDLSLQIRCAPNITIPSSHAYSAAKVYDLTSHSRLLCIDVHIGLSESGGTLFVPSLALLGALPTDSSRAPDEPLVIAWPTWAPKASWADTQHLRTGNECYMFGQRCVAFQEAQAHQRSRIVVFDFDPRRLLAHRKDGEGVHMREVCAPEAASSRNLAFCAGEAPAGRKYIKTVFTIPGEQDIDFWDMVMMDDEHIVVKKVREEGKFSLLVYDF